MLALIAVVPDTERLVMPETAPPKLALPVIVKPLLPPVMVELNTTLFAAKVLVAPLKVTAPFKLRSPLPVKFPAK